MISGSPAKRCGIGGGTGRRVPGVSPPGPFLGGSVFFPSMPEEERVSATRCWCVFFQPRAWIQTGGCRPAPSEPGDARSVYPPRARPRTPQSGKPADLPVPPAAPVKGLATGVLVCRVSVMPTPLRKLSVFRRGGCRRCGGRWLAGQRKKQGRRMPLQAGFVNACGWGFLVRCRTVRLVSAFPACVCVRALLRASISGILVYRRNSVENRCWEFARIGLAERPCDLRNAL